MTTMLHSEFDYDTSGLKRAIQHGEAKPTTRNHSQMTIFPLGLPLTTRTRLADLSFQSGESQAEIIRQAIDKILDEGVCGVEQVTGKRAQNAATRRAHLAQEKETRAQARKLVQQERRIALAAKAAQRAAQKAEGPEPVLAPTQPEPSIVESPIVPDRGIVSDIVQPEDPVQLDRPTPPSPEHTWVRGGINRCGYWRAPKRTKLAI